MRIKILILTDNKNYWLQRVTQNLNKFEKCKVINDEYYIKTDLFSFEIISAIREPNIRGKRYSCAILDKAIHPDVEYNIITHCTQGIIKTEGYYED